MKDKYLQAFMDMTDRFAQTSESTRLQVGACLIKNDNPVCFGINGTIPGWETNFCEDDKGNTADYVNHAEINCLNKLRQINETARGGIMIVTHAPCLRCAHELVHAGIERVYYKTEYRDGSGILYLRKSGVVVFKVDQQ